MIKVGTDFSGIGSPEQAIKNLGIKHSVEFACEIDKHSRKSYQEMNDCKRMYEDITKRNHSEVDQLDLYVAGFPCQAFSIAGKRQGFEDVRGTLFFNVAEFIKTNQPKAFVLENVRGLLSHDSGRTFQTIIDLLSNGGGTVNGQISFDFFEDGLGYHIHHKVLNSKEHGMPHNRERVFIVGFKESRTYNFPKKETLQIRLKDLLEDAVDEKYFLSPEMIKKFEGKDEAKNEWIADYRNDEGLRIRPGDISLYLSARRNSEKDISTMPPIIKRGKSELIRLKDIPLVAKKRSHDTPVEINKYLKKHKVGTNKSIAEKLDIPKTQVDHYFRIDKFRSVTSPDVWIKLKELFKFDDIHDVKVTEINETEYSFDSSKRLYSSEGIAQTLTTSEPGYYEVSKGEKVTTQEWVSGSHKVHSKIRRLTPLECWRLQGFPDDAFFQAQTVSSDMQLYKQAGNSITVNVIQKVIKNIFTKK